MNLLDGCWDHNKEILEDGTSETQGPGRAAMGTSWEDRQMLPGGPAETPQRKSQQQTQSADVSWPSPAHRTPCYIRTSEL